MKISILGSGCATCKKLHETVEYIVKTENIDAEVEYSNDVSRIAELGLMRSPVLVIDGEPVDIKSISEKDVKEAICSKVTQDDCCCAECNCSCSGNC